MKAEKHLQYCLYQIEEKLNWGKSSVWKEPEFLQLSKLISKETEISISPQTLKRLYGKIKYKDYYNPQRATKDALVKFLGFNNWTEFTKHYEDTVASEEQREKWPFWKRKSYRIALLVLSVAAVLMLLILYVGKFNPNMETEQNIPFSFDTTDSVGSVPYTVSVSYNIKQIHSDSIYVDFDFKHPITGPELVKLDKQRSLYNYTYQIPGYYHISLYRNDRELTVKNILATSHDWDSYLFNEGKQVIWLDNKIKASKTSGYLYYSPQDLVENGFDINAVFYVDHRIFKDFEIDGDNFEMKVRFKNSEKTGGITCYDFVTTLFCEKNFIYFKLMERGCSGYSGIKVGKTELNGVDENLSSFTFNTERWNNLYIVVKEKKVQVFVNNELIFSNSYQGSNGKILGIEQMFKGIGMLDYVRLKDLGTQQEFFDDFE